MKTFIVVVSRVMRFFYNGQKYGAEHNGLMRSSLL